MNLTLAELAALPAPAALLHGDDVVVSTPEWAAAGPGAVSYPLRRGRLVVGGGLTRSACLPLLGRLLDELDGLAGALPRPQNLRVAMVASSLGLLAGRLPAASGTTDDVIEHAAAGVTARTGLHFSSSGGGAGSVLAPPAVALILVQLAANAERHDGASAVELAAADGMFSLSWWPDPANVGLWAGGGEAAGAGSRAAITRRRADRIRWGLGFARIAADAVGGALFPPIRADDGRITATLELGLHRLALPLCAVRDGRVLKATRAWDEETGAIPPAPVKPGDRLARCVAAAELCTGEIASVDGWSARRGPSVTWVAVPPDGLLERARDVLDGMVHERALWDGVPEAPRMRVVALAAILGATLGVPLPRVPSGAWNRASAAVAAALGLRLPVPCLTGVGAVDPQVALYVAAEIGERFEDGDDELFLRVAEGRRTHPIASALLEPGSDLLRLS